MFIGVKIQLKQLLKKQSKKIFFLRQRQNNKSDEHKTDKFEISDLENL